MKYLLAIFLMLIGRWANSQTLVGYGSGIDTSKITITPKLGHPFGTITKLDVEIYDGESLHTKWGIGKYLLKVNSVNDKKINDTILLGFTDETESLANENFGLYKLIYNKSVGSLTSTQIGIMKKKYVGKKLTLMVYETGHFTGIPNDYEMYHPERADVSFHFEHYLVVVSNLTK